MIGSTILHYKILKKLGQGGMGIVYLAEDLKLERKVAVKFLPNHISANSEEAKRFKIEAKAAAALNHPNITTIHSIEESDEKLFIVMEYIRGKELKSLIKLGHPDISGQPALSLPNTDIINYANQIASGLETAHKESIIHRDVKSSNIMITDNGIVKIMDFGLAKLRSGTKLTQIGTTVGTIDYMSPEQALGQDVDQRSDIWSFGVVLYEMLTGCLPFKADYDQAVIYSILNEQPDYKNIPPELVGILKKMLAKSPADRYSDLKGFIDDINKNKSFTPETGRYVSINRPKNRIKLKLSLIISLVIICTLVILYFFVFRNNIDRADNSSGNKIAVLPFENLGLKEDNYFADGVTDEITSKLSTIQNLGVISWKSAKRFANTTLSSEEIARQLNVNYILEGSIQWSKDKIRKDRVRIIAQLILASNNTIIWSNTYDKVLDDIFSIQSEISQNVVNQLSISIKPNLIEQNENLTKNLTAYDYYLRGKAWFYGINYGKAEINKVTDLFTKAIELDSNFAAAYSFLSITKSLNYWMHYNIHEKDIIKALEYAQKAYQLNPQLAEAHLALGYYYFWYNLNYNEAIREFSEILKLQPNNPDAYYGLAVVYRRMGEIDKSSQCFLKSLEFDPLNLDIIRNTAETFGLKRDYADADKYYKKVIELDPNADFAKAGLAQNYFQWNGNLISAESVINQNKSEDYVEAWYNVAVQIKIYERKYDDAIKILKASKYEFEADQFRIIPTTQMLGFLYKYKNETKLSKLYFDSSKMQIEKMLKANPLDERLYSSLGITSAALGDKKSALSNALQGIRLMPLEKDHYRGYFRQLDMAIVYALIGNKDSALAKIDYLLSIPGPFSISQLKLDPIFDPLKNTEGYRKLLKKYGT